MMCDNVNCDLTAQKKRGVVDGEDYDRTVCNGHDLAAKISKGYNLSVEDDDDDDDLEFHPAIANDFPNSELARHAHAAPNGNQASQSISAANDSSKLARRKLAERDSLLVQHEGGPSAAGALQKRDFAQRTKAEPFGAVCRTQHESAAERVGADASGSNGRCVESGWFTEPLSRADGHEVQERLLTISRVNECVLTKAKGRRGVECSSSDGQQPEPTSEKIRPTACEGVDRSAEQASTVDFLPNGNLHGEHRVSSKKLDLGRGTISPSQSHAVDANGHASPNGADNEPDNTKDSTGGNESDEDWRSALSPIELSSARVCGPVMCSLEDVFSDVRLQAEAYYEQALRTSQHDGTAADASVNDSPHLQQIAAQIDAICAQIFSSKRRFSVTDLGEMSSEEQEVVNTTFDIVLPRADKLRTQARLAAAAARLSQDSSRPLVLPCNETPSSTTLTHSVPSYNPEKKPVDAQFPSDDLSVLSVVPNSNAKPEVNGQVRRRGRKPKNRAPDSNLPSQPTSTHVQQPALATGSQAPQFMLPTSTPPVADCIPTAPVSVPTENVLENKPADPETVLSDMAALASGSLPDTISPPKQRGRKKKSDIPPRNDSDPPATLKLQISLPSTLPLTETKVGAKRGRKKKCITEEGLDEPSDGAKKKRSRKKKQELNDDIKMEEDIQPAVSNILEMAMPTGIVLDDSGEVNVIAQTLEESTDTKKRRATGGRKRTKKSETAVTDQLTVSTQLATTFGTYSSASQASRMAEYDYNLHVAQQQQQQSQPESQPVVKKRGPIAQQQQQQPNPPTTASMSSMTSTSSQKGVTNELSPSTASTSAQARDIIDEYLEDLSHLQDNERMQQAATHQLVAVGAPQTAAPQDVNVNAQNVPVPPTNAVTMPQQPVSTPVAAVPQQPAGSAMQLFTLWPGGAVIETPADSALAAIAAYNDLYAQQRPNTDASAPAQPQRVAVNVNPASAQIAQPGLVSPSAFPATQTQPVPAASAPSGIQLAAQPVTVGTTQQQPPTATYYDPYAYTAANRFYTTAYGCDPALLAVATRLHPGAAYAYDAAYLMATLNAAGVAGASNQPAPIDGAPETPKQPDANSNDHLRSLTALSGKYTPVAPAQPGVAVAMVQPQQQAIAQSPQRVGATAQPAPPATVGPPQNDPYRMATDLYSQMSNPNTAYLYTTARDPLAAAYAGLAGQRLAAAAAVLNATASSGSTTGSQPQQPLSSAAQAPNANAASVSLNLNVNLNQTGCGVANACATQPTPLDSATHFLGPSGANSYLPPGAGAVPNGASAMLGGPAVNPGVANGNGQHYALAAYPAQAAAAYMQAAAAAGQKYSAGAQQQSPLLVSPTNVGSATGQLHLAAPASSPHGGLQQLAQHPPPPGTGVQQGAQDYFRAAAALYNPADAYQRFMMNRYY